MFTVELTTDAMVVFIQQLTLKNVYSTKVW